MLSSQNHKLQASDRTFRLIKERFEAYTPKYQFTLVEILREKREVRKELDTLDHWLLLKVNNLLGCMEIIECPIASIVSVIYAANASNTYWLATSVLNSIWWDQPVITKLVVQWMKDNGFDFAADNILMYAETAQKFRYEYECGSFASMPPSEERKGKLYESAIATDYYSDLVIDPVDLKVLL